MHRWIRLIVGLVLTLIGCGVLASLLAIYNGFLVVSRGQSPWYFSESDGQFRGSRSVSVSQLDWERAHGNLNTVENAIALLTDVQPGQTTHVDVIGLRWTETRAPHGASGFPINRHDLISIYWVSAVFPAVLGLASGVFLVRSFICSVPHKTSANAFPIGLTANSKDQPNAHT